MKHNKYKALPKISLHTGKVLCDINGITQQKEMYVVAGVSYDEVALVRLFGHNAMNEVLAKKCYRLSGRILLPKAIDDISLPLYADVTRLVHKAFLHLMPLLNSRSNGYTFRIPKEDLSQIILSIKGMNTISESVKSKYLPERF